MLDKTAVAIARRILTALALASPAVLRRVRPKDAAAWGEAFGRLARLRDERTQLMEEPLVAVASTVWRARYQADPAMAILPRHSAPALQVVHAALLALSLDGSGRQDAASRAVVLQPAARLVKRYEAERAAQRPPAAE